MTKITFLLTGILCVTSLLFGDALEGKSEVVSAVYELQKSSVEKQAEALKQSEENSTKTSLNTKPLTDKEIDKILTNFQKEAEEKKAAEEKAKEEKVKKLEKAKELAVEKLAYSASVVVDTPSQKQEVVKELSIDEQKKMLLMGLDPTIKPNTINTSFVGGEINPKAIGVVVKKEAQKIILGDVVFYGITCYHGRCVALCDTKDYVVGDKVSNNEKITEITTSYIKTTKRIINIVEIKEPAEAEEEE